MNVTDIDKIILKNIPTAYLQSLNWGFVDLCACAPHSRNAEGLGLCIVSGPLYVFIPEQSKGPFHAALCAEVIYCTVLDILSCLRQNAILYILCKYFFF